MASIPFLHARPLANGTICWQWKPSPRLRQAGWTGRNLAVVPAPARGKPQPSADVVAQALRLNEQVQAWQLGAATADGSGEAPSAPAAPRKWTFADLIDAYRASPSYRTEIVAKTRKEYDSRIRQLTYWAREGALPIRAIDRQMVADLKADLLAPLADGTPGSRHKCAAMLRVLRLLLRWARAEGLLPSDPTEGVKIPTPPSRTSKMDWRGAQAVMRAGTGEPGVDVPLAVAVAFWSMQRRADLIGLNRMAWRTFESLDPRDRPLLAGGDGEVRGFRLRQQKTGKWVDCPMPPWLHDDIAKAFARSQYLLPHPDAPDKPVPEHTIQRAVRRALDAAGFPDHQLRDLRRSGMSWAEDMGALRSDICTISGHQAMGRASILDTYMPPDTRGACSAIAAVLRTQAAIEQREKDQAQ